MKGGAVSPFHALHGSGISTSCFAPGGLSFSYVQRVTPMVIERRYPVNFSPMAKSKAASETPIQLSFLEPMECLLVSKLTEGPEWASEIKVDGYRAQALCDGRTTKLLSRNGNDLGLRFAAMVRSLAEAIPNGSIMDGGLVVGGRLNEHPGKLPLKHKRNGRNHQQTDFRSQTYD